MLQLYLCLQVTRLVKQQLKRSVSTEYVPEICRLKSSVFCMKFVELWDAEGIKCNQAQLICCCAVLLQAHSHLLQLADHQLAKPEVYSQPIIGSICCHTAAKGPRMVFLLL